MSEQHRSFTLQDPPMSISQAVPVSTATTATAGNSTKASDENNSISAPLLVSTATEGSEVGLTVYEINLDLMTRYFATICSTEHSPRVRLDLYYCGVYTLVELMEGDKRLHEKAPPWASLSQFQCDTSFTQLLEDLQKLLEDARKSVPYIVTYWFQVNRTAAEDMIILAAYRGDSFDKLGWQYRVIDVLTSLLLINSWRTTK